ncbi:Histidine kinase-, DNA gyrase B-, and HSP90-like ATPase [Aquimarina spongiae]|uniref:histidine kinase n=1 Tax=Aquimarina spongiae TaxID=570521 RepID=A0A1M6H169_9FLAO|nr:Histidine kinase-, DNA gyrase B-, and HSP90-like ATPase [Aquimarina spongiae]
MGFSYFKFYVLVKTVLLCITLSVGFYLSITYGTALAYTIAILLFFSVIIQFVSLFKYLTRTDKKLTRFLEAIKHSDFVLKLSVDNHLDKSFRNLNTSFNEVLSAFREERSEKEEHLQYLNTIVQQVNTGLICYSSSGEIKLINSYAKKLINIKHLKNIKELANYNEELHRAVVDLASGRNILLKSDDEIQLAIHSITIKIKNQPIKIIALQNIYPELQRKEIESWQNLTKILRHEIINSITPIVSLNDTMYSILQEDVSLLDSNYVIDHENLNDLKEGISTIKNRADGLISFIDAYRDYTNIPTPVFASINVLELLKHIHLLMKPELDKNGFDFKYQTTPKDILLYGDAKLLEMVLINLFKNAIEAKRSDHETPSISVKGYINHKREFILEITDNGKGIIPEAIDKIFIPFYTTKKTGSGIGLSLSRQILQMHQGTLTVRSEVNTFTTFELKFNQLTK